MSRTARAVRCQRNGRTASPPRPYREAMAEIIPLHPEPPSRPSAPIEPLWREAVGHVLRRTRHERGERLADTALRSGVSPLYLSEMERGRKEPSSEMLAAVAGALELTLVDLTSAVADSLQPAARAAVVDAA